MSESRARDAGDAKPEGVPEGVESLRGRSFLSFSATQYLGAFNDNVFKQLVLLISVEQTVEGSADTFQSLATGVFALPFLLFSGLAGLLSDRFSKTTIIRLAKHAEVVVMLAGTLAFLAGSFGGLLVTLFLMSTQSAFFAPAKYGVLPQMLPDRSLSRANGIVLMLTFVAVILGMSTAGWLKDSLGDALWRSQLVCIAIAVVGVVTAYGIRPLPAASPDVRVRGRIGGGLLATLASFARDRSFLVVVVANSYFWFLGSAVIQIMNRFGKNVLSLDDSGTSWLGATLSVGMAIGALLGGWLSRGRVRFSLSVVGVVGASVSLLVLSFCLSPGFAYPALLVLGTFGGLFGLPLQTYLQAWPPPTEKGRVIAAGNFLAWVAIGLSAGYNLAATAALPTRWVPASLGALTLVFGAVITPILLRRDREIASEHAGTRAKSK